MVNVMACIVFRKMKFGLIPHGGTTGRISSLNFGNRQLDALVESRHPTVPAESVILPDTLDECRQEAKGTARDRAGEYTQTTV